jgi:bifunctional non-homologous end joining protein LigD
MDPFPERVAPMFTTPAEQPPDGNDWLHEIAYDGYRLLCRIDGSDLRLLTSTMHDWTDKFPSLVESLKDVAALHVWLDGKLVFLETDGRPCFGSLRSAVRNRRHHCLSYSVFDLMYRDGRDVREVPVLARKQMLGEVLPDAPNLRQVDHILGRGRVVFAAACQMGAAGIISKRALSPYVSGRTEEWVKVNCPGYETRSRGWENWS